MSPFIRSQTVTVQSLKNSSVVIALSPQHVAEFPHAEAGACHILWKGNMTHCQPQPNQSARDGVPAKGTPSAKRHYIESAIKASDQPALTDIRYKGAAGDIKGLEKYGNYSSW